MNIKLSSKQKRIILIVIVVLVGVWFFWFRHYLDKQKFERLEMTMSQITTLLHSEFDLDVIESREYCSREGRKFEAGPLNCHISQVYPVKDVDLSEEGIVNFILAQPGLARTTSFSEIFELIEVDSSCYVSINSRSNTYPRLSISPIDTESNYIEIECSSRASTSHFQFVE